MKNHGSLEDCRDFYYRNMDVNYICLSSLLDGKRVTPIKGHGFVECNFTKPCYYLIPCPLEGVAREGN
jgi:hypothetical protein